MLNYELEWLQSISIIDKFIPKTKYDKFIFNKYKKPS
jgi:hypothetical protein